jgi:hypothetical protein
VKDRVADASLVELTTRSDTALGGLVTSAVVPAPEQTARTGRRATKAQTRTCEVLPNMNFIRTPDANVSDWSRVISAGGQQKAARDHRLVSNPLAARLAWRHVAATAPVALRRRLSTALLCAAYFRLT